MAKFCRYLIIVVLLTHISLASFLWDIDKQRKPRSDDTERAVWSGSPLFAYRMFSLILNKNEKYHTTTFKTSVYDKEIPRPHHGTARKSFDLVKCRDNVKQEIFYNG